MAPSSYDLSCWWDAKPNTHTDTKQFVTFPFQNFDVSGLMLALTERHSEMPAPSKSAMPVTVPDPDNKPTR